MEALISHFTFLSNQACCHDKHFDPYAIEDLMKLFEVEAYNSWAAMELEQEKEVEEAETSMQKAEDYLDYSVMESAMNEEFRRFEGEMERIEKEEYNGLNESAEKAKKMGKLMEEGATFADIQEAADMNSASASMKAAFKGVASNRVHPS